MWPALSALQCGGTLRSRGETSICLSSTAARWCGETDAGGQNGGQGGAMICLWWVSEGRDGAQEPGDGRVGVTVEVEVSITIRKGSIISCYRTSSFF